MGSSSLEGLFNVVKTTSNSTVPPFLKSQSQRKLSATVIFLAAALCSSAILLFHFPQINTFPITVRYPECGHIVLVSVQRHGSTWFINNAENCVSVNGSYADLILSTELWNHGKVENITLENAIDLVHLKTSVKLFPDALNNHREDVRAFLKAMRDLQIPVFVLRRQLEDSYASLQAVWKTHQWDRDNRGTVVQRVFKDGERFSAYRNRTETYFKDVKTILNDIGIAWDEVQYETILSQRVILGRTVKCFVRNCNFLDS